MDNPSVSGTQKFKIFCDESCHLEKDSSNVMVLGALSCPENAVEHLTKKIKYLRHKHNYLTELKWTKLIGKQADFYRELLDMFLDTVSICGPFSMISWLSYRNWAAAHHFS